MITPGRPGNRPERDELSQRDAVDRHGQDRFHRVHLMDVGHPGNRQDGQRHDAHTAAEITAVNGNEELYEEHCKVLGA